MEKNSRENCKPDYNEEIRPSNELICTIKRLGPSMRLSFQFRLENFDNINPKGDWRGLLHFKEKAAPDWCCSIGSRIPAIFINSKTRVLRVYYARDREGDWYKDSKPLDMNIWQNFTLSHYYRIDESVD